MLTMLQSWKGTVEVNGQLFDSIHLVPSSLLSEDVLNIKLHPVVEKPVARQSNSVESIVTNAEDRQYEITVKAYMTRKASPEFDFMAKWNNDNPMPLRTMRGIVDKETRGMVHMKLRGVGKEEIHCMRCGRQLTHPVSRHYGIGPECMQKVGIVADIDDVESIKEQLVNVEWEGWIIKSAITEQREVIS